ncbi:hypothetical protein AGJ35_02470 [Cronobacter dublinensis subsp. dublinensis]|nr:hypothetical protein [Cronobacter dublinensis subsp. dublinensis]EGT5737038.1 hypothetical protein [Cronobacter dublinensis subsp. dublinensis]
MFKRAYLYPNPGGSGHAGGMNALNFIFAEREITRLQIHNKNKSPPLNTYTKYIQLFILND